MGDKEKGDEEKGDKKGGDDEEWENMEICTEELAEID
jgi:hypothetical protein